MYDSDKIKFDHSIDFCDRLGNNLGTFINKSCINLSKTLILGLSILFFGIIHMFISFIRSIFGK